MESKLLQEAFLSWTFPLFLFIFVIIALLKATYPHHFSEYLKLPFNNKYIIIYEKKERKVQLFTVVSFFLQWFSLSLFFYIWGQFFKINLSPSTGFLFLDIAFVILCFLILKLFIQKGISYLFDLKGFSKTYIFSRIAYSSYASIFIITFLFFLMFSTSLREIYFYILLTTLLIINILGWINIIKIHQKAIKPYIIYFILYLCTFEIAPYVFLICKSNIL
ncbi:DUF4271 domain-containing protein [Capnocytophaga cynodegmi]|uniref:DUF4271 domain-containing protein n=1 Tax=Capnocytophaga cynodegmi TaxID=28189 RepID=A0A250E6M9_9FLAO|nr:DUF4271 domain-containing protein [Capnocytophaga cynodegmi]ATA68622.1 DUF4271 domain-containing protein [Capnocytophaga cynodegmi]